MRSNFRKTTITILLVLCMAVSVFAVSAFAEDANSTSTNADSTSVNHTCERKVVEYTATQAAKYIAGDNTYPEVEGYLFAGWYNNEACTKAGLVSGGTPSGEKAYALYVPEHVLSIQAQASANLMDEKQTNDAKGSLRFITSVDSLLYKQVGFEVYYVGADNVTRKATSASNKVYSKLYEMDSENVWEKTPSDTFCNLSKYFKICTLKNFTMQTYMETEFTVKPYWITMDGDKVYGVEATKKFSEGCLRDTVWVSNDGKDEPNYGDYNDPYATLDYAIEHVEDGGTVRVKDELTVATWGEVDGHGKTITITGDGKNDDATDAASLELETLTFTEYQVCIYDAVTFEKINIALSATGDLNKIFAEGNHVKIAESVNLTNEATKLQVFGGGKDNVVKNTELELYAGTYNGIYAGGIKDVTGNTKVTIGGKVNPNAAYSTHDDTTNMVFGGCYDATVHGNTTVIVESGAKANYIYGGGDAANSKVLGSTNVEFEGQAYCVYGGSRKGTNADTHVKMESGELYQIFGGCEFNIMTGDTDVQVLGGTVHRRVYGGCYNADTDSWASDYHVTGYTTVSIGTDAKANLAFDDYLSGDHSLYALSRDNNSYDDEKGVFIFNDYENCSDNIDKIGPGTGMTVAGLSSKSHHYQINATSGGTVYSAGNCIYIVPDDENTTATVTINDEEKHYTAGKSYYPLPAGHDASKPIVVTFGGAKESIPTDYKAKIGSAYYLTLDEAIAAADKMKDADIETINDSTQELAKITVLSTENGTVTSSCKNCVVGADSTVTLTVTPDEGYNCTGVSVTRDGNTVALDKEVTFGATTYTFTADTAGEYTVEATFARKIFSEDGHTWNISTQYEGTVSIPEGGNKGWLPLYGKYTDINLSFVARDYQNSTDGKNPRTEALFKFDSGNTVSFGVTYDGSKYLIQSLVVSGTNSIVPNYTPHGELTTSEITQYKDGGIELRIIRSGAEIYLYVEGRQICSVLDICKSYDKDKNVTGISGVESNTPATVYLRHYDDVVTDQVDVEFTVTDKVEIGTLTIKDSENGAVVSNKTNYFIGDEITLTPKPNPEDTYNCASLIVDGKEVELTDGVYTFTATDIYYEVEAVFAKKIFKDTVTTWNVSKQYKKTTVGGTTYDGCVSYPNANGGSSTWLDLYGQYGDIDLTIRVRDYVADYAGKCEGLRQLVKFTFTNGATASFSITYTGPENKPEEWSYQLQPMGDSIFKWKSFKELTNEQIASYQDEDGIEFRVLRYGTMVNLYLDGELVCEGLDLTSNDSDVTEDMLAAVTIRNYDNKTEKLEIPFTISTDVDRVSVNIEETKNGTFTTPKKNYLKGETIVVTAKGNDGYYYKSLEITDNPEIEKLEDDGTYSFEAVESEYTITGSFAASIFKENQLTYWNIINQHKGIIVQKDYTGRQNTFGLDTMEMHGNSDISVIIKAQEDDFDENGNFIDNGTNGRTDNKGDRTGIGYYLKDSAGEYTVAFSVVCDQNGDYYVGHAGTTDIGYNSEFELTDEEQEMIKNGDGAELRLVRTGEVAKVYLAGRLITTYDLPYEDKDVTVWIRRWDDPGFVCPIEYKFTSLGTETVAEANISISTEGNGTITTDKETDAYIVGEKVTLTVAGNSGYYCSSLTVDGAEVPIDENGNYTFTATKEQHEVKATFAQGIFASNSVFNLVNQNKINVAAGTTYQGALLLTSDKRNGTTTEGDSAWLRSNSTTYGDVDVRLRIKDATPEARCFRMSVMFENMEGNQWMGFSVTNHPGALYDGDTQDTYRLQTTGSSISRLNWQKNDQYKMSDEQVKQLQSVDGIEFRVVRVDKSVNIYIGGEFAWQYDISEVAGKVSKISVRSYGNIGTDYVIPYSIESSSVTAKSAVITIDEEIVNGTLATTRGIGDYIVGEKVTLTATGNEGYYCNSLTVNGEEIQPNWDGTYTFTASETDEVYATFAKGPFTDNGSNWNFSRQNYGVLVPNYASGGNSGWADAEGNFTEISMTVKDYVGKENQAEGEKEFSIVALYNFDNGKWGGVRIINEGGTYKITEYGSTTDANALTAWKKIYTWDEISDGQLLGEDTDEKLAKIETDGVEFKLVRADSSYEVWLEGTMLKTLEFDGITADNAVTKASIRHYGNPITDTATYKPEVPFSLVEIKPVELTLAKNDNGVVTTNVDNYFVGDTVTATVSPDAGYVIDCLKVNGSEVALNKKGTYTFEATDESYELEPVFNRKIFVDDTAEWNVANQYNGSITSNSDGNSPWLFTYDYYKNMDFTVTMKDQAPDDKNFRFGIQFTFENGKNFRISITNDGSDTYSMQHMGDSINPWKPVVADITSLNSDFVSLLQGETGLEMRVVRTGLKMEVYLNDTLAYTYENLAVDVNEKATGITENMKVTVSIRHYGNSELDIEMPFKIGETTEIVKLHDTDLFYANNKYTEGTDPFVLDNTAVDGYYYMYSTQSKCYCYRSKNMMDWEYVGDTLNYKATTEFTNVVATDVWAPEVVYDSTDDLYYMFFSATPAADTTYTDDNGGQLLFVATSKYPYKGFELVDFTNASSCGAGNVREYDTTKYPHYYAKYLMLDQATYSEKSGKTRHYLGAIDPHPYVEVDAQGNEHKYLFWVDNDGEDRICGVKMNNWLQPDWSTFEVLTCYGYYTVEDAENGSTNKVSYELSTSSINEGPVITKRGNNYYLTFSVNAYADNTYQVAQAVSTDGILGTYRKLTEAEGGLLLSAKATGSAKVSGAGHHSFVTVGDQMYIVYHRHNDVALMGSTRNHAIDEVKWVTNGAGLEVMYVNGPTSAVQPKIEAFTAYKNIAGEATVTGSGDLTCLTDGLVSVKGNADFMAYVSKLTLTADAEYTFTFAEPRTVRAVMVYNSGEATFTNASVKYVCEENGKEVTYTKDLAFDENASNEEPGAAAYATLHGYNVKKVIVTVNVPSGTAGISEIKILGK